MSIMAIHHRWKSSVVAKIFTICFVATHLPLIAALAFFAVGAPASPEAVLTVLLAVTLVATALCLLSLDRLLRPITSIAQVVEEFGRTGKAQPVGNGRHDEVGVLARGVDAMMRRLESILSALRLQAYRDTLTEIGNRRWLSDAAQCLLDDARDDNRTVPVVVFDIDHFKSINDEFGHAIGDAVLKAVSDTVQCTIRRYDPFARIGGEEFCVVLEGSSVASALQTVELLRMAIEQIGLAPLGPGRITASFGVHLGDPRSESFDAMMQAADAEMYRAKERGRNRTSITLNETPAFVPPLYPHLSALAPDRRQNMNAE